MDNDKTTLTPMMRQYEEIKNEHQDKVLFFRLGDFYEMFNEDALNISKLLNLTLTHRNSTPMCGIPYHAAKSYLKRLLDYGLKVAVCEQFVDPDANQKLAERKVAKIYTPATVVDDEYLDSLSSSYVVAINIDKKNVYLSWSDISTGEFYIRNVPLEKDFSSLEAELVSIMPKEILVPDDFYFGIKEFRKIIDLQNAIVTKLPTWYFSIKEGRKQFKKQFSENALRLFGIDEKDPILTVIGALLSYLADNAKQELPQLRVVERVSDENYLALNPAAVRNLELITSLNNENKNEGTLFSAINKTKTPSGARFLKFSLLHPLSRKDDIEKRQRWIEHLISNSYELDRVRKCLCDSSDMERLSTKASMKRVLPRDLIAIAETIVSFISLVNQNQEYLELVDDRDSISLDSVIDFSSDILKGINRECTNIQNPGTIILDGYDSELDDLRKYISNGSDVLSQYLDRVRAETGITTMKLGENRIIGSYIEVSKGQLDRVPDYFIRRQTLVGGERFTTNEFEEIKQKLFFAESDASKCEKDIYNKFIIRAFDLCQCLEKIGKVITLLDFYSSFAKLAIEANWTKPEIMEQGELDIVDGRHPVVEAYVGKNEFVANSFSTKKSRLSLITGPNMAGKSTYLRQVAIIALLAHVGCYVPAKSARVPLIDKIFCRVGASDNLSKGESTFLVEMSESAQILRGSTSKSLVIMDEIGRGTSTQDGMSLAYAIMNYLKLSGSITLFATHYHELTMLDTSDIQLLHMAVLEQKNTIVFLRKVEEGVSESSYGIHVAKLAGLPRSVIKDAVDFQRKHFIDYLDFDPSQGNLFAQEEEKEESIEKAISEKIQQFDIDSSTPLEAMLFLTDLKKMIEK